MKNTHKKPKQARGRMTVEAILQATEELINEAGFDEVTTNKVAQRAGVSIGSVYQFFPNKESIFVALEERLIEDMSRDAGEIIANSQGLNAAQLAEKIIDRIFQLAEEKPQLIRLFSQLVSHPGGKGAMLKLQESIIVLGRQLLLEHKDKIRFDDAHTTAYVLTNMCVLLIGEFFSHPQSYVSQEQFKKELLTIISARMSLR